VPENPIDEPDSPRALRAQAAKARRLGDAIGTQTDRRRLHDYAARLDAQADEMEAHASAEPAVTKHQNPMQMQQARLTPPDGDEQN
jgi:hypothetical protein